jgi:hypothetical protein
MSMVGTVIRLTHELTRRTAHAIVHPVETATGVAGMAGNAASAAAAVVTAVKEADREPVDRSTTPQSEETTPSGPPEPAPREAVLFPPEPTPTPEPSFTEPKPSDIDDWEEEAAEALGGGVDDEDLDVVPEPDDDTPLLDPSVAKAVRHEAQTMSRAAEREPEGSAGE